MSHTNNSEVRTSRFRLVRRMLGCHRYSIGAGCVGHVFLIILTRRSSMKNIMLLLIAGMCLVGFSSLSFAEDMGKMKGEMKGHQDEMKGEMKGNMGAMKNTQGEMKSDMKAQHNE